ncbi:AGAP009244-PA, partial [Anopheles gambiae str. PEST]
GIGFNGDSLHAFDEISVQDLSAVWERDKRDRAFFFFFQVFFRFWKSANTSRTKVGVSARSFVPCFRHKYNVNPTKLTERSVAPPAQHRKRHFSVGSFVTKTRHTAKRQMEQTPATIASAVG